MTISGKAQSKKLKTHLTTAILAIMMTVDSSVKFIKRGNSETSMAFHWLLVIGGVVLQLILSIAVVSDARSRGHNGFPWLIFTLFFGIFAAIVYMVVRRDERLPISERPDTFALKPDTSTSESNTDEQDSQQELKFDVDEEDWESLPTQFGIDYQTITDDEEEKVLLVKRDDKLGEFIISPNSVRAEPETEERNSEKWVQRTSKLLDAYFN